MSNYSVAQVEAITGINAHTLRIWERRYAFLNPMRTETNIRYYSDKELRKLLSIAMLQRNGFKISKLDKMDDQQIGEAVEVILASSQTQNEDEINNLMLSMLTFDENKFDKIFQRQIIQRGLLATVVEIIYPFLYKLGVLWGASKVFPAQEHFISNLIRQKLISGIDALPIPPENSPTLMMFLAEEEHHEIGLLLSSFIARKCGWRVIYLGQNVPSEDMHEVVSMVHIDFLVTMIVSPQTHDINPLFKKLIELTGIPIILSGKQDYVDHVENNPKIIKLHSPKELNDFLESRNR
jgi:DNA-binding transcriptional MerR regulator